VTTLSLKLHNVISRSSDELVCRATKHGEIDLYFIAIGDVHILNVLMTSHFVNIFTKGYPSLEF
jgi:hypothetical protein